MQLSGLRAGAVRPRRDQSKIKVSLISGAILLMATASACAQHAAPGSVNLLCRVEGVKLLSPATTEDAVCGEIKREIDGALSRQTTIVKTLASAGKADWIKVDVRIAQPGTASATVVQSVGGREAAHPEIAVDVMDKSLGSKEINRLATEIARAVGKPTIHK